MSDFEIALRSRLLAHTDVAALVSANGFAGDRPEGTPLPAFTLRQIVPGRRYTHDGANDLHMPLFQIDCWGTSYAQAKALRSAVIAAIESPTVFGGFRFGPAFLSGDLDAPVEDLRGGGKAYRRILEFTIYWKE